MEDFIPVSSEIATDYIEVVNIGDDKGLIITEQLSVGSPASPKESVFGEGDSYGVGKEDTTPDGVPKVGSAWHCDIANTTGFTITSAVDVTTILSSDSDSTTGLFGGESTGLYILVGSDYTYGGVKAKMDTLGTIEPANVIGEYLASASGWVTAPFMATDGDFPYTQKGNQLASCSSCSEQWRFGFNPLSLPVSWEKVTLTINGTEYTKYWSRFRITSDITLDPIMEQIKVHTNRFEINADGATEYFGKARYARSIETNITANANKTPISEDIKIAVGITEAKTLNEFADGKSDGLIVSGVVPEGIDTSIPTQVIVDWYAKGTNTGNVELELETVKVGSGFVYDGTATSNAQTPVITAIDNDPELKQSSTFLVDVSTGLPQERIYASLFRDATSGNTDDTFVGNIVITRVQVIGYFWKP